MLKHWPCSGVPACPWMLSLHPLLYFLVFERWDCEKVGRRKEENASYVDVLKLHFLGWVERWRCEEAVSPTSGALEQMSPANDFQRPVWLLHLSKFIPWNYCLALLFQVHQSSFQLYGQFPVPWLHFSAQYIYFLPFAHFSSLLDNHNIENYPCNLAYHVLVCILQYS